MREVCREYEVAETLYYSWRDRLLEGGKAALANPQTRTPEHAEIAELRKKVASLERDGLGMRRSSSRPRQPGRRDSDGRGAGLT